MYKRRIDKEELVRHVHDHRRQTFLEDLENWYEVDLSLVDFENLLINSIPNRDEAISASQFPTIKQVREIIASDSERFFATERVNGGINGPHVKKCRDDFRAGVPLCDCFIVERYPNMNPQGSYYIRDGMHRLVAYALYSEFKPEFFPIRIYLGLGYIQK